MPIRSLISPESHFGSFFSSGFPISEMTEHVQHETSRLIVRQRWKQEHFLDADTVSDLPRKPLRELLLFRLPDLGNDRARPARNVAPHRPTEVEAGTLSRCRYGL